MSDRTKEMARQLYNQMCDYVGRNHEERCIEALTFSLDSMESEIEAKDQRIERLEAVVDAHDKFAWLCYEDYGFWGNGGNDNPVPCLLLNDVFVLGADAFELSWKQVIEVYGIAKNGVPQDVWDWVRPLQLAALDTDK